MQRKGVSEVITTILLILLVLVGISVIWIVVRPTIEKTSGDIGFEQISINLEIVVTSVSVTEDDISFNVKRNPGKGNVVGLKVILEDIEKKEALFNIENFDIEELETRNTGMITYTREGLNELTKISIAPVFDINGQLKVGAIVDVYEFLRQQSDERTTACNDSINNDVDGWKDTNDPGCHTDGDANNPLSYNASHDDESNSDTGFACSNNRDDDRDTLTDGFDGGCTSWDDNDETDEDLPLIWPPTNYESETKIVYLWSGNNTKFQELGYDNLVDMRTIFSLDPNNHIEEMQNMPPGHKAMLAWNLARKEFLNIRDDGRGGAHNPYDNCTRVVGLQKIDTDFPCIWWSNGRDNKADENRQFFSEYRGLGGELDFLSIDEESHFYWGIASLDQNNIYGGDKFLEWCEAIENDSRWGGIDDYGFNITEILGVNNISDTLCDRGNNMYRTHRELWRWIVIKERMSHYLNDAVYQVTKEFYPDVQSSNYFHYYTDENYSVPLNNREPYLYSDGSHVGTHQSPGGLRGDLGGNNPNEEWFTATAFNALRYDVNLVRAATLANPDVGVHARYGSTSESGLLRNKDLFQENYFHGALTDVDDYPIFNPGDYSGRFDFYMARDRIISELFRELDIMIGYNVPRQTLITELSSWGDDFIYTGMKVGDYKVWRFTPEFESGETIDNYLISENDNGNVKFRARSTTQERVIVFPDAIIYYPVNSVSNQGFWIIQLTTSGNPYFE